ncbi:MAG: hypothetical protein ACXWZM_08310 [Solirubrobacterales bacterium]
MTVPRSRRVRLAAALIPLALLVCLAAPSGAGMSYPTNLFMSKRAPAFHGRVHSPGTVCVIHRKVRLYRARRGPDKLLGTDRSDARGAWKVRVRPLSSGAYYARAKRFASVALGFVCRGDRSRLATVD